MFVLRCPNCKHTMKCDPKGSDISGKSKRCVYCGKSFRLRDNILKKTA